jgi:hypothetical protein
MPRETRERNRYGLLLLATVALLAVQGTVDPGAFQRVVVTGLAGASLLLAFRAARLTPRLVAFAAGVAAAALVVSILRATVGGIGEGPALTVNAALVALGPPAIAVGLVRDLRATGVVQIQSLFGVLSLYMLIGMAFGFVYGAIDRFGGDPFFRRRRERHRRALPVLQLHDAGHGRLRRLRGAHRPRSHARGVRGATSARSTS